MSVEIESVQPPDADRVRHLLTTLSADSALGFSEEALRHYWAVWTVEAIRQRAVDPRQVLMTARVNGQLAGLLLGTSPEGGVATIIWVLVADEYRRQGVGGRMFMEACHRYRLLGCHKIKLTAPTLQAVAFYEKQGMKREGFHPDHWWRKEFWSMGMTL